MRKTITISVSEEMYMCIFERARLRFYSSVSEYVRSLVRKDQFNDPDKPVGEKVSKMPRTANECMADPQGYM